MANKLITLDNLSDFYNKLKTYLQNTYLSITTADNRYAKTNGDLTKDFKADSLQLGGQDTVSVTTGVVGSGARYVDFSYGGEYSVRILLSDLGLRVATTEDVNAKADRIVMPSSTATYYFTSNPKACVLKKLVVSNVSGARFSPITGCSVKDVIYISGFRDVQDGLYFVKSAPGSLGATMDNLQFLETPSVYTLYCSLETESLYVYNGSSFDKLEFSGGSSIIIDGETYATASETDITDIINGTYGS